MQSPFLWGFPREFSLAAKQPPEFAVLPPRPQRQRGGRKRREIPATVQRARAARRINLL